MKLFVDTETTGFPRSAADGDPSQPHLVSLAALLTDHAGNPLGFVESIIKPEGWTIPDDAADIHGITTETATRDGKPLAEVILSFMALLAQAKEIAAYNLKFDAAILRSALVRAKLPIALLAKPTQTCVMREAAEVMQLPTKKGTGFKNPNLREAYRHFYGEDFPDAHSATSDMLACAAVHFAAIGSPRLVQLPVRPVVNEVESPVDDLEEETVPSLDEAMLAIRTSPGLWFETCSRIEDKEKNLVPPTMNIFQRRMSEAYESQRAAGVACRQICLKPRRVGGTTMGAAITYHHIRNFPCNGIMIADTHGKSEELLKMYGRFAQNDGFDWQAQDSFGITGATLGHSNIRRQSAEAPKGTRGLTLMALHSSEVAFWPSTPAKSADETSAALRSALAKHAQTSDIEESTPKGASGIFYTLWQDARWPEYDDYWQRWGNQTQDVGEGNGYIRVFAAWFEFTDYALPLSCDQEGHDIQATLTAREKRGIELYDWTPEQIKWRRLTIKRDCLNDERRFDEEYPEDPVSCFLSSGSPRFDNEGMTRLEVRSRSVGVEHGILSFNEDKVAFRRTGENESIASVWEHPRVGCSYLIAVDPNSGKIIEGSTDRDGTSVQVWRAGYVAAGSPSRRVDPRLAARLRAPWQAENKPTARFIDMLSRLYGRCIVIVENNVNSGLIDKLKELEVPLYLEEKFDLISSKTTRTVGWATTNDTRHLIIDALADVIRDQGVDIGCPHMVSELRTFVRTKTGKFEAASGRHDDDVMCGGIAVYNLPSATKFTEKVRKRQPPADAKQWQTVK